jgi:hypothetical protein
MTPNLDRLSVLLARRLGDPADTDGNEFTTSYLGDGVAYTNLFRVHCLTEALRLYLNMFGHDKLQDAGFPLNYMKDTPLTFALANGEKEEELPADVARVIYVDYYGHMALPATFERIKRRHHMYWQKTAMYRVRYDAAAGKMYVKLYVPAYQSASRDVTVYYIRTIGDLVSGGSEDIELDPLHDSTLLALAEAVARRNHQEAASYLSQSASASLQQMKENI